MAARRCRSCKALAIGGEVPVVGLSGRWLEWHLCGRCWSFLVLGLRTHLGNAGLDPFLELEGLRLRPSQVHAAIREGTRVVSHHSTPPPTPREVMLEQNQWMLEELEDLVQDVEANARRNAPGPAWETLRQRIYHVRGRLRELRRRYPGVDAPPSPAVQDASAQLDDETQLSDTSD